MKKTITISLALLFSIASLGQSKVKYSQMENPATSSVNLGTQTFNAGNSSVKGFTSSPTPSGAIISTTTTPSQIVFSSTSQKAKCAVGLIGTPETNLTYNMDYSNQTHRYYDTTNAITGAAAWWTLSGSFCGLQYVPQGYGNTTQGGDMWSRSGAQVPFWFDPTNGNAKFNGTLKIGASDKTSGSTNTTSAIYARDMTTQYGFNYVSVPTLTASEIYGIAENISASTSSGVYGSVITASNTGTGDLYGDLINVTNSNTISGSVYGSKIIAASTGTNPVYGLHVTSSNTTTSYGIYSASGKNYFSGNTGIGTATTPTITLDVKANSSGTVGYFSSTILGVQNNGRAVINIMTPAANDGYLMFGSPTANNRAWLSYTHSTDKMDLHSSGTITLDKPTRIGSGTAPTYSLDVSGNAYVSLLATLQGGINTTSLTASTKTIDAVAGDAATINGMAGRFRKDNSGSSFTLTNNQITTNSVILLTLVTGGITTGYQLSVQAGSGSATITFETNGVAAAPSTNCDVNFIVIN